MDEKENNKQIKVFAILGIVLVLIFLVIGVFIYLNKSNVNPTSISNNVNDNNVNSNTNLVNNNEVKPLNDNGLTKKVSDENLKEFFSIAPVIHLSNEKELDSLVLFKIAKENIYDYYEDGELKINNQSIDNVYNNEETDEAYFYLELEELNKRLETVGMKKIEKFHTKQIEEIFSMKEYQGKKYLLELFAPSFYDYSYLPTITNYSDIDYNDGIYSAKIKYVYKLPVYKPDYSLDAFDEYEMDITFSENDINDFNMSRFKILSTSEPKLCRTRKIENNFDFNVNKDVLKNEDSIAIENGFEYDNSVESFLWKNIGTDKISLTVPETAYVEDYTITEAYKDGTIEMIIQDYEMGVNPKTKELLEIRYEMVIGIPKEVKEKVSTNNNGEYKYIGDKFNSDLYVKKDTEGTYEFIIYNDDATKETKFTITFETYPENSFDKLQDIIVYILSSFKLK